MTEHPRWPFPAHATGTAVEAAIVARLEEAGKLVLRVPVSKSERHKLLNMSVEDLEGHKDLWLDPPTKEEIARMDEALAWIALIPLDRYVLRRVVGARCLISVTTGRHLFSWRRLGTLLGADHQAIRRWHAQGIALIAEALK